MQEYLQFSPAVLAVIPLVVGLVSVAKGLGLPGKWAPVASIALGIGLMTIAGGVWQAFVLQGIIAGLAASGLWSGTKAIKEGATE